MRARIPYLARLARQAGSEATLQPPRQLFAGDAYTPRPAGRDEQPRRHADHHPGRHSPRGAALPGPHDEPAPLPLVSPPGENMGAGQAATAPGAFPSPSSPGSQHAAIPRPEDAAAHLPPAGPDVPGRAQIPVPSPIPLLGGPAWPAHGSPAGAPDADAPLATAPDADLEAGAPMPPDRSRPAGEAAQRQPAGSRTDRSGGAPAEPTWAIGPAPVTGRAAEPVTRRAAEPVTGRAAEPVTGGAGVSVPLADRSSGGPARAEDLGAAVRDLLPPPVSGPRPGGSSQRPRDTRPSQVSIGTIEVTVVPPTAPAAGLETRPPSRAARDRSRPASLLAANAGTDRLRDGVRRWYGTAQG
jgi:hypothetical protein